MCLGNCVVKKCFSVPWGPDLRRAAQVFLKIAGNHMSLRLPANKPDPELREVGLPVTRKNTASVYDEAKLT